LHIFYNKNYYLKLFVLKCWTIDTEQTILLKLYCFPTRVFVSNMVLLEDWTFSPSTFFSSAGTLEFSKIPTILNYDLCKIINRFQCKIFRVLNACVSIYLWIYLFKIIHIWCRYFRISSIANIWTFFNFFINRCF